MYILLTGLIIVMLSISSCAYNKQTMLEVSGDEIKVPLSPMQSIEGKGMRGSLYRNVSIAFPGTEAIKEFRSISSSSSQTGEDKSTTIDVD